MSSAATEVVALFEAFLAAAADGPPPKPTISYLTAYLHHLKSVEASVARLDTADVSFTSSSGVVPRIASTAIEHALGGHLPWLVLLTWENLLRSLLLLTYREVALSHLVRPLWEAVVKWSKDRAGAFTTTRTWLLCAALHLLRVLLPFHPVELDAMRKHLPHPVKTVAVEPRVASFRVVPWVVLNLKRPLSAPPLSSSEDVALLTLEFFEYFRKGATSTEPAVREAAIEAIRSTLELGVGVDQLMAQQLLDLLLLIMADTKFSSSKMQEDLGKALAYVLAFFQTGFQCRSARQLASSGVASASWAHFGGVTPMEAERTARQLLRHTRSPKAQNILGIALGQLMLLTVNPFNTSSAIQSLFILLVPTKQDNRTSMSHVLASAFELYSSQLPFDSYRSSVVYILCRFIQREIEQTVIVRTAVMALKAIVPTLFSTGKVVKGLVDTLYAAAATQPALVIPIGEVLGALAERSASYCRRLLLNFEEQGLKEDTQAMPSSTFLLLSTAILSASTVFQSQQCLLEPLLSAVMNLRFEEAPVDVGDVQYSWAEYFFLFVTVLFEQHKERLSPATCAHISTLVQVILGLLVSNPSQSSAYFRAATAACSLVLTRNTSEMELNLCVGLIEVQEMGMHDGASSRCYSESRSQLRGQVYRIIAASDWFTRKDEGSLRWVTSQALSDIESLCSEGIPVSCNSSVLFPVKCIPFLQDLRCQRPSTTQQAWADAGEHSAHVIAWGVRYFSRSVSGLSFCTDVFRRLEKLHSFPAGVKTATATVQAWNVLFCWHSILRQTAEGPAEIQHLWTTEWDWLAGNLKQKVKEWSAMHVLDNMLLSATVFALLQVFTEKVDEYTMAALKDASENDGGCASLAVTMLTLGSAHALYCSYRSTRPSTFPVAAAFIANACKRNGMKGGDARNMLPMAILLAAIRMATVYPEAVEETLAPALTSLLLTPQEQPMDPLTYHLLLVLALYIPSFHGTSPSADVVLEVLYQAVSPIHHPLPTLGGDGAVLKVVSHILSKGDASLQPSMYVVVRQRLLENLMASRHLPSLQGLATTGIRRGAPTAKYIGLGTSSHASQCIAELLCACEDVLLSQSLVKKASCTAPTMMEIAAMTDAAAMPSAREAWTELGRVYLEASTTSQQLILVKDMCRVIHAKAPLLPSEGDELDTATDAAHRNDSFRNEPMMASRGHAYGDESDEEGILTRENRGNGSGPGKRSERTPVGPVGGMRSDVPAKRAMLTLLAGVFKGSFTSSSFSETYDEILRMVVTVVSTVESTPEVLDPATDMLVDVLYQYGNRWTSNGRRVPYLLMWKAQLVSIINTVMQLSVGSLDHGCELVRAFMNSNLADSLSMKRMAQALSLMLLALERMESAGSDVLAAGAVIIVMTLSALASRAEAMQWSDARTISLQALLSSSGQEGITFLCKHLVTSVSLVNLYEPAFPVTLSPQLDESPYCTAGATLQAVEQTCKEVGFLGPTVRYAVGCLACIVAATDGADVQPLCNVVQHLSTAHQEIIVQFLSQTLLDTTMARSDEDELLYLEVVAAADCQKGYRTSNDIVHHVLKRAETRALRPRLTAALLQLVLQVRCPIELVVRLLHMLPLSHLRHTTDKLVSDVYRYYVSCSSDDRHTMALCCGSGLILVERSYNSCRHDSSHGSCGENGDVSSTYTPLSGPFVCRRAMALLGEAFANTDDPLIFGSWTFPRLSHDTALCRSLLYLIGGTNNETLIRKWGALHCHVVLALVGENATDPLPERMRYLLSYLATQLCDSPRRNLWADVLQPVAVEMAHRIHREHPVELREAIRSLRKEAVAQLRLFMEHSTAG